MTHRVVSSHAADEDLAGAVEVYRQTAGTETAARFVDAVEQCLRRIAAFPSAGSSSVEGHTGIPGLRRLAVEKFPSHLFYTADEDVVRVHRVLHACRDVEGAFVD
ncbi:type II toxin-antitoxin system RelE/ParE family toxin [Microbacterium sp. PRF11]|uniref:type II toxin-antitoxin system RelE/ParE family toxin n=1 Tax=Microbacterium sp. PRF11 TaxID=2962593 RepID=UPI0028828579|nr:type II toxin-antitoxin system RelE/ParE family toxin [Microbacterium sp. PRF11]MDT0116725.1 type II toxin-antitoxin system RelE/ParE family toxin [Microbacterium sp. PRF11]